VPHWIRRGQETDIDYEGGSGCALAGPSALARPLEFGLYGVFATVNVALPGSGKLVTRRPRAIPARPGHPGEDAGG